jgi:hypothetical protein
MSGVVAEVPSQLAVVARLVDTGSDELLELRHRKQALDRRRTRRSRR